MTPLQEPNLRSQEQDPEVPLLLRLSAVRYISETLNRNPVGAPVMAVAKLMADINDQVEKYLAPPKARGSDPRADTKVEDAA